MADLCGFAVESAGQQDVVDGVEGLVRQLRSRQVPVGQAVEEQATRGVENTTQDGEEATNDTGRAEQT